MRIRIHVELHRQCRLRREHAQRRGKAMIGQRPGGGCPVRTVPDRRAPAASSTAKPLSVGAASAPPSAASCRSSAATPARRRSAPPAQLLAEPAAVRHHWPQPAGDVTRQTSSNLAATSACRRTFVTASRTAASHRPRECLGRVALPDRARSPQRVHRRPHRSCSPVCPHRRWAAARVGPPRRPTAHRREKESRARDRLPLVRSRHARPFRAFADATQVDYQAGRCGAHRALRDEVDNER